MSSSTIHKKQYCEWLMLKRISEYHSIIKPDFNGGKGDRCICTSAGIVQNISNFSRSMGWILWSWQILPISSYMHNAKLSYAADPMPYPKSTD